MWCFAVVFSFIQLINDVAVQTTDGIRLMNVCDNNNLHVCSDLLVVSGAPRGADDGDEFPPAYNSVFCPQKIPLVHSLLNLLNSYSIMTV